MTQLANQGYIEYPLHNGEINKTGLGKICWEHFDVECTETSFLKTFTDNKLSETKRKKFEFSEIKIPLLADIK